jgi:peroxiredoxin
MRSSKPALLPQWASTALVVAVGFGVSGILWMLVEQNRLLKATIEAPPGAVAPPTLQAGDILPSIRVVSETGEDHNIAEFLDVDVGVVAVLTATCPFCERSLPVWNEIAVKLSDENVKFVGLLLGSAEEAEAYQLRHSIGWTLWSVDAPEEATRLGVARVPTTAVFSRGGVVTQAWIGALADADAEVIAGAVRKLRTEQ